MSVFKIFGDHTDVIIPNAKNVNRLAVGNENIGKLSTTRHFNGPIKPNEPLKKLENKKTFLVNKGKTLISTPMKPGTPFGKANLNTQAIQIYSDNQDEDLNKNCNIEAELEFHKPVNQYDKICEDIFDDAPIFSYGMEQEESLRAATPEPDIEVDKKMEFNYSYDDDFFKDDFSNDSITIDNLELPSYEL